MPVNIPNVTPDQFRSDRLAQVKAIIQANPGINIEILDGLSIAGIATGIELRVGYVEATNTLEVRRE